MKPLKNTVVHLPTQEEYYEYMRMCEEAGWNWCDGDRPKYSNLFPDYKGMTCVRVSDGMGYCGKQWYEKQGFKVITLKQLKSLNNHTMNKTLETLEVGDLVTSKSGGKVEIIALLNRNGEKTAYVVLWDDGYTCTYSAKELEKLGYTPYTKTSYEIEKAMKVLTDAGRIVDGKIIK